MQSEKKTRPKLNMSRVQDENAKVKIRIGILGPGHIFGNDDLILGRNYTTTLKCLENDSEAFVMTREDFLRLFKSSEDAWELMFEHAVDREKQIVARCYNFVSVASQDQKMRVFSEKKTDLADHIKDDSGHEK